MVKSVGTCKYFLCRFCNVNFLETQRRRHEWECKPSALNKYNGEFFACPYSGCGFESPFRFLVVRHEFDEHKRQLDSSNSPPQSPKARKYERNLLDRWVCSFQQLEAPVIMNTKRLRAEKQFQDEPFFEEADEAQVGRKRCVGHMQEMDVAASDKSAGECTNKRHIHDGISLKSTGSVSTCGRSSDSSSSSRESLSSSNTAKINAIQLVEKNVYGFKVSRDQRKRIAKVVGNDLFRVQQLVADEAKRVQNIFPNNRQGKIEETLVKNLLRFNGSEEQFSFLAGALHKDHELPKSRTIGTLRRKLVDATEKGTGY